MKALLFDLDGTIGNTVPLCIAASRAAIEPLLKKSLTDEEITRHFGPSEKGTIAALLPKASDEGMLRYIQIYEQLHRGWAQPFEGIVPILELAKARGVFLGMVTGKGSTTINDFASFLKSTSCDNELAP